jgi:hypothetical protein
MASTRPPFLPLEAPASRALRAAALRRPLVRPPVLRALALRPPRALRARVGLEPRVFLALRDLAMILPRCMSLVERREAARLVPATMRKSRGGGELGAPVDTVTFCDSVAIIASGARGSRTIRLARDGTRFAGAGHRTCSYAR